MDRILKTVGDGYYEEKKSKFIARCYPMESPEEAEPILAAVRKQYYDARHNCYAYVCGDQVKASDDGEPSGTAGKPILEVIRGAGLVNCLVVVTRYFGGTLLGTGGLVRAYQTATQDALAHATIVGITEGVRYEIRTDYNQVGKIQRILPQAGCVIVDTIYADAVTFVTELPGEAEERMIREVTEACAGRAEITFVDSRRIETAPS